jgi:hypothetical protein
MSVAELLIWSLCVSIIGILCCLAIAWVRRGDK